MIAFRSGSLVEVNLLPDSFGVGILKEDISREDHTAKFSKFWFFKRNDKSVQLPETLEDIELSFSIDRFIITDIYTLLVEKNIIIPFDILFEVGD